MSDLIFFSTKPGDYFLQTNSIQPFSRGLFGTIYEPQLITHLKDIKSAGNNTENHD